jgi:hypothetical protein
MAIVLAASLPGVGQTLGKLKTKAATLKAKGEMLKKK